MWIKCQDRMPKPEDHEPWERVLVLVDSGGAGVETYPSLAYLDTGGRDDRWRDDRGALFRDGVVTHWMKITSPA